MKLTPEITRLHELFHLTEDGVLIRKISVSHNNAIAGDVAGSMNSEGYLRVMVDRRRYLVHRVAFAMIHWRWPTKDIDHINGVKTDNRPANLREVSYRENQQNTHKHRAGKLPGCYFHKSRHKWCAQAQITGRMRFLGYFHTEKKAHDAYCNFLREVEADVA